MVWRMNFAPVQQLAVRMFVEVAESALFFLSLVFCIPAVPSSAGEASSPSLAGAWLPLMFFVASRVPSYLRKQLTVSALLLHTGVIALFYVALSQRSLYPR